MGLATGIFFGDFGRRVMQILTRLAELAPRLVALTRGRIALVGRSVRLVEDLAGEVELDQGLFLATLANAPGCVGGLGPAGEVARKRFQLLPCFGQFSGFLERDPLVIPQ